jgi:hypothetical protein
VYVYLALEAIKTLFSETKDPRRGTICDFLPLDTVWRCRHTDFGFIPPLSLVGCLKFTPHQTFREPD